MQRFGDNLGAGGAGVGGVLTIWFLVSDVNKNMMEKMEVAEVEDQPIFVTWI